MSTSGVDTVAAVKRPGQETAWGDVATDPTQIIPLISESMTSTPIFDHEEAVENSAARQDASIVGQDVAGTIVTDLWYEGLEYLFLAAFGFECPSLYDTAGGPWGSGTGGSPAPDTVSSPDAYHHVMELDNSLRRQGWLTGERDASSGSAGDPEYWTSAHQKVRCFDLYIDKTVPTGYVHCFSNCMVKSVTLKAGLDGVTLDWELVAYQHLTDTTANYNRSSWALPSVRHRAVFPQFTFAMGAAGGTAPSSVAVKEFSLKLDNSLEADRASGSTSVYIIEPVRANTRKVTGTINLARYDDDTFPDWKDNETDLQINAYFQSSQMDGSLFYWTQWFLMPLVRVTKADFPTPGPGVITGDIEYEAYPASTPTWMTTFAGGIDMIKEQELCYMFRNTRGWSWLRDNQDAGLGDLP